MFTFQPSARIAQQDNKAMNKDLVKSLSQLVEYLSSEDNQLSEKFEDWVARLPDVPRLSPHLFAAYYEIVECVERSEPQRARQILFEILDVQNDDDGLKVIALDALPVDHQNRIIAYMGNPETGVGGVGAPKTRQARKFSQTLDQALDWIDLHLPSFSEELRELIQEIVLVGPDHQSQNEFEGGTCFRLWGTLALNADRRVSLVDLVLSLVHEAGHARLFGACRQEMLVRNPDSETHWSPIRGEERPLEGIFHATFVSARMIWAIQQMSQSAPVTWLDRLRLKHALRQTTQIYTGSVKVLSEHAVFTQTGQEVFDAMQAFMAPEASLKARCVEQSA